MTTPLTDVPLTDVEFAVLTMAEAAKDECTCFHFLVPSNAYFAGPRSFGAANPRWIAINALLARGLLRLKVGAPSYPQVFGYQITRKGTLALVTWHEALHRIDNVAFGECGQPTAYVTHPDNPLKIVVHGRKKRAR